MHHKETLLKVKVMRHTLGNIAEECLKECTLSEWEGVQQKASSRHDITIAHRNSLRLWLSKQALRPGSPTLHHQGGAKKDPLLSEGIDN